MQSSGGITQMLSKIILVVAPISEISTERSVKYRRSSDVTTS